MTRTKLFFAFALVLVPLAMLTPAPAPTDKLHLVTAGRVKVANLIVNDVALIDENRIVIVGRNGDPAEDASKWPATNEGLPNGAIVNLGKKSVEPFTNLHRTQIWGVSSHGSRVVTGGTDLDPFVRIWDLRAEKTTNAIKLDAVVTICHVRCLHHSDRVVADALESLLVIDPAKPKERTELARPAGAEWLTGPLAVSPDDAWIVCAADRDQVVCFEVATKKATVLPIAPAGEDREQWHVRCFAFSPSGKLFVCRQGGDEEVPKGTAEKDVPAERRGIVRIDLPEGKVVPLNMGHTWGTFGCAIDGRETWLGTVGRSHPDKQPKDGHTGELRVYNLASGKLAYREQLREGVPGWVWFTPSGKRLVCVTTDGTVRWWDVPVR